MLVALLATADCAPARTFARVTWLLVTIALVSTVFAVVSLTFGERIDLGRDGIIVRLLDIGENGLGVAVAGLVESGVLAPFTGSLAGEPALGSEVLQLREHGDVMIIMHDAIAAVWPLGVGFGTVEEAIFAPLGRATSAHSAQLTILAETGIIGLALLVAAWLGYGALRLANGRAAGTLASGLAIVVAGLYAHQMFDSAAFRFHPLHFLVVYFIGELANSLVSARGAVAADGG